MTQVFLDSSVLLAFSRSATGASAYILECCEKGKLKGYVSQKVFAESKKNAREDMGSQAIKAIDYVINHTFLEVVEDASEEELNIAHEAFNNPKDEPIIAAAKQIPDLQYILSLDNGFFKDAVLAYVKPLEILKPGEFVNRFREELEK